MTLNLTEITVSLRDNAPLFSPVSCQVSAGEVLTILGPSGSGKSTLLDAVGGHLSPVFKLFGNVQLNGYDVTELPAEKRRIGILFQDALMFPHLSVGDNLAFGLAQHVQGRSQRRAAINEALKLAGLTGFYNRDPSTLSGGQRARAALMRTLLAEPHALLLDEPFSKLDPERRSDIRDFVFHHIRARNIPVLLVTHDEGDAKAAKGTIITLEPSQQ